MNHEIKDAYFQIMEDIDGFVAILKKQNVHIHITPFNLDDVELNDDAAKITWDRHITKNIIKPIIKNIQIFGKKDSGENIIISKEFKSSDIITFNCDVTRNNEFSLSVDSLTIDSKDSIEVTFEIK